MQTTYNNKPATAAFAGSIADLGDHDIVTRTNNEGSAIPFGIALAISGESTVDLPDNTADLIVGIAVHHAAFDPADLDGEAGIEDDEPVSLMVRGRIWCICEDGCDDGDEVWVRHAANGGNTQLGRLLGADDGANASKLAGAVWRTTAAAGALAILEINLNGSRGAMT